LNLRDLKKAKQHLPLLGCFAFFLSLACGSKPNPSPTLPPPLISASAWVLPFSDTLLHLENPQYEVFGEVSGKIQVRHLRYARAEGQSIRFRRLVNHLEEQKIPHSYGVEGSRPAIFFKWGDGSTYGAAYAMRDFYFVKSSEGDSTVQKWLKTLIYRDGENVSY